MPGPTSDEGGVTGRPQPGGHGSDYGLMFAGSMILIGIPLLIIIGFQRYLIQFVATSGLK